jgi:hypothetical protein
VTHTVVEFEEYLEYVHECTRGTHTFDREKDLVKFIRESCIPGNCDIHKVSVRTIKVRREKDVWRDVTAEILREVKLLERGEVT